MRFGIRRFAPSKIRRFAPPSKVTLQATQFFFHYYIRKTFINRNYYSGLAIRRTYFKSRNAKRTTQFAKFCNTEKSKSQLQKTRLTHLRFIYKLNMSNLYSRQCAIISATISGRNQNHWCCRIREKSHSPVRPVRRFAPVTPMYALEVSLFFDVHQSIAHAAIYFPFDVELTEKKFEGIITKIAGASWLT